MSRKCMLCKKLGTHRIETYKNRVMDTKKYRNKT